MKEEIHPKYFKTIASCACGATYEVGSTKQNIKVDICSACHPVFTGKQKLIDIAGRVEKFKKKYEIAAEIRKRLTEEKSKKQEEKKVTEEERLAAEEERITEKLKASEIVSKPKKEKAAKTEKIQAKPKTAPKAKKTKAKSK